MKLVKGSSKWTYEYFSTKSTTEDKIDWSKCDPALGIDRHQSQPFGDDQHCLAYHYDKLYAGTEAECTWGMYDQKCYDDYENFFDYDHRLTICTDLPSNHFLPGKISKESNKIHICNPVNPKIFAVLKKVRLQYCPLGD